MAEALLIGKPKEGQGDFERPTGEVRARIADVTRAFKSKGYAGGPPKTQFLITFVLEPCYKGKDGKETHFLHSEYFSATLHSKGKLRSTLMAGIAGKPITDTMIDDLTKNGPYDVSKLVGKSCRLVLEPKSEESDWQRLKTVLKGDEISAKLDISGYKRPDWIKDLLDASEDPSKTPEENKDAADPTGVDALV